MISGVLLKAQNLIAVQSGSNTSFYTNLDTAIVYAQSGDYIYLPGGFIPTAGNIIINKVLNIVGVGYNPDTNFVTGCTIIQHDIEVLSSVNGGSITGLYAKNNSIVIDDAANNFKISRCYFNTITIGSGQGSIPASNILIIETIADNGIFSNANITSPLNIVVKNCIIGSWEVGGWSNTNSHNSIGTLGYINPYYSGYFYQWNGLICKNSIVFGLSIWAGINYSSYLDPFFKGISYSTFENCIFIDNLIYTTNGNAKLNSGSYNNTFRNCIFNQDLNYISDLPINFINNCFFSQNKDSIFVNVPLNNTYHFSLNNNYHLQQNFIGKNAGKDGTDVGIYGGDFPWKNGSVPSNPNIIDSNIGGTTNTNGALLVNIKVAAQDH